MATIRAERRLSAVLASDVVGYSRLIEADEAGTLSALRGVRTEILDPLLAEHQGRVVKLMGDGLLAEFGSVVDAVSCAVAMQRAVVEHQAGVTLERRITFRIGINLGDVVVEGDDLLGDGVNVAARLEQLCEPGGVLVSGTAYDHLQGKLGLPLDFIGEQQVKNIARPVRTYSVRMNGLARASRWRRPRAARILPRAAGIVLALSLAVAGWWWLRPVTPASAYPSVAVLPFENLGGDATQDYLGDGIAEDIITMLSSFPTLRVVSRMSSFRYDNPAEPQDVAQELGVDYILEGTVRKSAAVIRVTVQLIEAKTGDHIWAERLDQEGEDIVALQAEVADKVYSSVAGLTGRLRGQEEHLAWQKSPPSLEEYDYYLRGHHLFFQLTGESIAAARRVWQEGLERFPDSALLRVKIGFSYYNDVLNQRSADPVADVERAWNLAMEARALPDKSRLEEWLNTWLVAVLLPLQEGNFPGAAAEAEAAVRLVPYDPVSLADFALIMANAGQMERAIEWGEAAVTREPHGPDFFHGNLGWAYYVSGRAEDALAEYLKHTKPCNQCLAAVYARLGRMDEAEAELARLLDADPGWTVTKEAAYPTGTHPQMVEPLLTAYLNDLRKAGLPE